MSHYIASFTFLDESHSFANGFEAGIIYNKCQNEESIEDQFIAPTNGEQIKNVMDHFGYDHKIEEIESDGVMFYKLSCWPIDISSIQ